MRTSITAFVVILISSTFAWADVVELKTGQRVEGSLKHATASSVTIEVGGQTITFPAEKVRAIYYGTPLETKAATPGVDPAVEAITALKGVESVLKAGVSYRDYSARVLDAKVVVDRVPNTNAEAKRAIALAMEFYVMTSAAWNASLTRYGTASGLSQYAQAGRNPAVRECPAVWAQIQKSNQAAMSRPADPLTPEPVRYGLVISFNKELLWSCASDKIAEAEQLVKQ